MNHSRKLMWGCVTIAGVATVLAVALTTPYYLLFVLPCVLMVGVMLVLMGGGSRRRGRE